VQAFSAACRFTQVLCVSVLGKLLRTCCTLLDADAVLQAAASARSSSSAARGTASSVASSAGSGISTVFVTFFVVRVHHLIPFFWLSSWH
jgi:hypothetical protein